MPVLNAASRASLAQVREDVESAAASVADRPAVADAVFAVAGVLAGNPGLRRTLAEASTQADDRAGLVRRLFGGRVPAAAVDLVAGVVAHRWSAPWDLVDAVEGVGFQLLLVTAEQDGHLEAVEDQLFRFGRIVAGDSGLRSALDDKSVPADTRAGLATRLLSGRADPVTVALVAQAVRSTASPSTELAIDDLLELTAARRERSIATVTSAVPLSAAQTDRLAAALSRVYGRTIAVRVDVDPAIRGGLVVRCGDEVIDGSVASRLAAARNGLGA